MTPSLMKPWKNGTTWYSVWLHYLHNPIGWRSGLFDLRTSSLRRQGDESRPSFILKVTKSTHVVLVEGQALKLLSRGWGSGRVIIRSKGFSQPDDDKVHLEKQAHPHKHTRTRIQWLWGFIHQFQKLTRLSDDIKNKKIGRLLPWRVGPGASVAI